MRGHLLVQSDNPGCDTLEGSITMCSNGSKVWFANQSRARSLLPPALPAAGAPGLPPGPAAAGAEWPGAPALPEDWPQRWAEVPTCGLMPLLHIRPNMPKTLRSPTYSRLKLLHIHAFAGMPSCPIGRRGLCTAEGGGEALRPGAQLRPPAGHPDGRALGARQNPDGQAAGGWVGGLERDSLGAVSRHLVGLQVAASADQHETCSLLAR